MERDQTVLLLLLLLLMLLRGTQGRDETAAHVRTVFEEFDEFPRHGKRIGLWMACYFYSSGTEKDAAPLELALTPDGCTRGDWTRWAFSLKGSW